MSTTNITPSNIHITVHHLNASRSTRILALLEELHLPYTIKLYTRDASGLAPASLKAIHPLGKSPVVEIQAPGQKPLVLAESAVIVEYLYIETAPVPFFVRPITKKISGSVHSAFLDRNLISNLDFLEAQLKTATSSSGYLCGNLTSADFMMIYPLEEMKENVGMFFTEKMYPMLWAYLKRLQGREGYRRAREREEREERGVGKVNGHH